MHKWYKSQMLQDLESYIDEENMMRETDTYEERYDYIYNLVTEDPYLNEVLYGKEPPLPIFFEISDEIAEAITEFDIPANQIAEHILDTTWMNEIYRNYMLPQAITHYLEVHN